MLLPLINFRLGRTYIYKEPIVKSVLFILWFSFFFDELTAFFDPQPQISYVQPLEICIWKCSTKYVQTGGNYALHEQFISLSPPTLWIKTNYLCTYL